MAIKYLDFVGGNDANDGSSFALRKKSMSSVTGVSSAGDTIRVLGYPLTNTGLTGTWSTNSPSVTLSSAVNKTFDTCEAAWTAGTGITASTTTSNYKQGTKAITLAVGGGYVNGTIAGLKDLGSTQDFSAYQVVNLWIQSSVTFADSDWSLVLCSDAAGATPVNTLNLPAVNCASVWQAIIMDNGSAMSSTVRSIYLKRNAGATTPTLTVDIPFASKAKTSTDYLGLDTLIGKNASLGFSTTGVSPLYLIKYVDGTTLKFQSSLQENAADYTPYVVGEAVALYALRMPILAATTVGGNNQAISNSGSATADITISGGWDSTAMSSQDGYSYVFAPNYTGYVFNSAARSYFSYSRFGSIGGVYNFLLTGASHKHTFTDCVFTGGAVSFYTQSTASNNHTFTNCYLGGNTNQMYLLGSNHVVFNCVFEGMSSGQGAFGANNTYITSCDFIKGAYCINIVGQPDGAVAIGTPMYFRKCQFIGSATADVTFRQGPNYFDNCVFGGSVEVTAGASQTRGQAVIYSTNHDQTANNHQQWHEVGKIISDSTTRHTASGIAWKMSPTGTLRDSTYPLRTVISRVYCVSGVQTTVSAYFAKDHANISVGLFIRGGQLGGPASDTTQLSTCGTGSTYESTPTQIQWTPTSSGVVEIEAICYTSGSTTSNGWVDDVAFA